ncbi:hypothetical protein SAMN02745131_01884 [Flavisolibacter ginsengisoli DSM 18119]|uniref:Uncharacterized protein n=1 Tax=Flavisolibacter ginsengisoli DSM 18119 TaxID=1121884 RepID=A0A1M4Z5N5_9BACT|nr:hypothetical protein SAMN02745131_01884 [Flavisolibacter ginsengisoli DSM 18119]
MFKFIYTIQLAFNKSLLFTYLKGEFLQFIKFHLPTTECQPSDISGEYAFVQPWNFEKSCSFLTYNFPWIAFPGLDNWSFVNGPKY